MLRTQWASYYVMGFKISVCVCVSVILRKCPYGLYTGGEHSRTLFECTNLPCCPMSKPCCPLTLVAPVHAFINLHQPSKGLWNCNRLIKCIVYRYVSCSYVLYSVSVLFVDVCLFVLCSVVSCLMSIMYFVCWNPSKTWWSISRGNSK